MTAGADRTAPATDREGKFRWGDWLAPALILVTPFVNFLGYHDYGLFYPDSLLAIVFLAGIGVLASLLTRLWPGLLRPLFLALALVYVVDVQPDLPRLVFGLVKPYLAPEKTTDAFKPLLLAFVFILSFAVLYALRRNAGTVLAAAFAVMLATTILIPGSAETKRGILQVEFDAPAAAGEATGADLPTVVHIVLDEHIGVEGIPGDVPGATELREAIKEFYLGNGFRLYGGAFSPYYNTENSIANLLNGALLSRDRPFLTPVGGKYALAQNAWFDFLGAQGYRIKVYQADFMEACGAGFRAIRRCTTYPSNGIFVVRDIDAKITRKTGLLFTNFLNPSSGNRVFGAMKYFMDNYDWDGNLKAEVDSPLRRAVLLGALWSKTIFEQLTNDLRGAKPGEAYYAHLLIPHRGYILDENCGPKLDLSTWYGNPNIGVLPGQRLSESSRAARYVAYFKQIRCTQLLLGKLMDALSQAGVLEKAIVIVHGDHGSRITGTPPLERFAAGLTRMDLVDSFSTHFAIRSPDTKPGYDTSTRSIHALFAELALRRPLAEEPAVLFITPNERKLGTPLTELPLPNLRWDGK